MKKIVLLSVLMVFVHLVFAQNVGIGTATPSAKLDVNGNARIRTLPAGAATDVYLSADASGNIRTLPGGLPMIASIQQTTASATTRGAAGGSYAFPAANNTALVNTIPGATVTTSSITVPAGTYQVFLTYSGSLVAPLPGSNPIVLSYFYDFPSGAAATIRIHNNTASNNTTVSNHGGLLTLIVVTTATRSFPFNIGWGAGGTAATGNGISFDTGCELSLIKLR